MGGQSFSATCVSNNSNNKKRYVELRQTGHLSSSSDDMRPPTCGVSGVHATLNGSHALRFCALHVDFFVYFSFLFGCHSGICLLIHMEEQCVHICKNGKCHRYVRSIRTCWSGILLVGSCSLRCCCITGETAILTMFPKPFHAFFSLALTGGLPPDRPRLRSTTGHPNYLRSLIAMLLTFLFGKSLFNDTCIRARAEAHEILGLLSQLDENVC